VSLAGGGRGMRFDRRLFGGGFGSGLGLLGMARHNVNDGFLYELG